MLAWILAATLAVTAPAPARVPAIETQVQIQAQAEVMALPPELRSRFEAEVLADQPSRMRRFERLLHFMFDAQGLGMSYEEGATHNVEQAYATRKANCVGFTVLFLALAREAGLDAYPQEIEEVLSWRQHEGTVYRNNHVNAGVRIGKRKYVVDVARNAVIARRQPVRISDQRLLAHFYNNLAVNFQAQHELTLAQRNLTTALTLDPDYASHWSNAGVFHVRNGDLVAAERAYQHALALDPNNSSALFNLAGLLRRNGDVQRAAEFQQRLARVHQRDPFQHFLQAMEYERSGDIPRAIEHYEQAIRLHRREHRFYSALAGAYLRTGDTARAGKALTRALKLSEGPARAGYQAQLDRLR